MVTRSSKNYDPLVESSQSEETVSPVSNIVGMDSDSAEFSVRRYCNAF